jgi:hypothetical protein
MSLGGHPAPISDEEPFSVCSEHCLLALADYRRPRSPIYSERSASNLDNCKSKPLMHSLGSPSRLLKNLDRRDRTVAR